MKTCTQMNIFQALPDGGMTSIRYLWIALAKISIGGTKMRTKITLACTECKRRNYNMTKDKKNHPERMETKKYCRFCKAHTLHKETK